MRFVEGGYIHLKILHPWKIHILNPKVIEVFGSDDFPLSNWIQFLGFASH